MSDYPEILNDVKSYIIKTAKKHGLTDEHAETLAHDAAEDVRRNWGGMLIYIGKGHKYDLSNRDLQIWTEFNTHNHHALCQKYNISLQQLYRIIAIQQHKEIKEKQDDLFDVNQ